MLVPQFFSFECLSVPCSSFFKLTGHSIIAVQGLGSSYDWTWSREIPGSKQRYHWLRSSIPRDFEHARVLAFDYDSKWIGDVDSVSLQECGSRLLRAVIEDRCHIGDFRMCLERVGDQNYGLIHLDLSLNRILEPSTYHIHWA